MGLHDCSSLLWSFVCVQSHLKTITRAIMRALNGDNSEGKEHNSSFNFFFPLKNHSLENVSPLALLICWRVNFTFWALKIILYFWPLCGFIFSRLKEPKYLVHTEENCKLSKFDLELVGNCRSTNCRAGTTQKQNSMIYLIVVIHRHTQYIKAVFFPFFSFSWNNFPKKEFRRIESSSQKRDGMQMLLCCFYVRVEKEACGNNGSFFL